ncbi:MarR family winged helix-turn-helix transcriptional regulator [Jiella sonneratiae]|uniref:Winged helix-turn-helix transcriptional regulator n=1 Tax=Jiella sonneratiae TaxID=2816856 RepID=A0ABS3J5W8_9HYPH|nr:MarR family winged helix-turn-helix transcriptional regulator [Jiella sonneratiae]MBO0905076.1 winged helix-turn-helix transcriptional regulator [Jiella sonneratiae]
MNDTPLFSGSNLGFLLSDATRLLRRRFDQTSRDIDMTSAQMRIIVRLCRNEGISQAALAAMLDLEPMTLCRHIDRMASSGLVVREQDPNDRRARQLFTTEKARELMHPMRQRAEEIFEEAQKGLSETARRQLAEALAVVVNNLSEAEAAERGSETASRRRERSLVRERESA